MSQLRFDGQGAGLGQQKGGNANSPYDYTVVCGCKTELGVLGAFSPNAAGARSVLCPVCAHVTVMDRVGQITYVKAPPELVAKAAEARKKQVVVNMGGVR